MLNIFTNLLSLMLVKNKIDKLNYLDDLIYLGRKIKLLLSSIVPDTNEILAHINNDERLNGYIDKKYLLNESQQCQFDNLFSSLGRYDLDSQIQIVDSFIGYFELEKEQYEHHLTNHKKLYLSYGALFGIAISIILL